MLRIISIFVIVCFLITGQAGQYPVFAQDFRLPAPGAMVYLSPDFTPAVLKGITIHPENPLMFDFIINRGDKVLTAAQKQEEYKKLIKYFLASLAIPDEDQWVNLSPYEKDRIIKDDFGKTLMGRDLLSQDYILKQITASLIYPEKDLGKKFWANVYAKAQQQYGTTDIPVNTFNKVWILPDEALVYEKGTTAYVLKSHLKVMLEEDYLALTKHVKTTRVNHRIASEVVREIVLPALQKEVNEGKNFAMLRQVYSGMILSAWFKRTLRKSILGQIYADKSKVQGIDQDPQNNEAIYQQYLRAYKKGVFNYIKDDADKYTNETIPRKYFSGGFVDNAQTILEVTGNTLLGNRIMAGEATKDDSAQAVMSTPEEKADAAMTSGIKKSLNEEVPRLLSSDQAWQGRKAILDAIGFKSGNSIVSIGDAGDWRMGLLVAWQGGRYVGFDADGTSTRMVARVKYNEFNVTENGGDARLEKGLFFPAEQYSEPIADHSQDFVFSGIVSDPGLSFDAKIRILEEAVRVIKDGGKIPIITPVPASIPYERPTVDEVAESFQQLPQYKGKISLTPVDVHINNGDGSFASVMYRIYQVHFLDKTLLKTTDRAMIIERVLNSPGLFNLGVRHDDFFEPIKKFLIDHNWEEETLNSYLKLSDDEILDKIDDILRTEFHKNNLIHAITARELFINPTQGAQDTYQAMEPILLNAHLMPSKRIQNAYLILLAISILTDGKKLLFEESDSREEGDYYKELNLYTNVFGVGVDSTLRRFLSFSQLLLQMLLNENDLPQTGQELLAQSSKVWVAQERPMVNRSIHNYLKLVEALKKNPKWKEAFSEADTLSEGETYKYNQYLKFLQNLDRGMTVVGTDELKSAILDMIRTYDTSWKLLADYNGQPLWTEEWPYQFENLADRILRTLREDHGITESSRFAYLIDKDPENKIVTFHITDAAMLGNDFSFSINKDSTGYDPREQVGDAIKRTLGARGLTFANFVNFKITFKGRLEAGRDGEVLTLNEKTFIVKKDGSLRFKDHEHARTWIQKLETTSVNFSGVFRSYSGPYLGSSAAMTAMQGEDKRIFGLEPAAFIDLLQKFGEYFNPNSRAWDTPSIEGKGQDNYSFVDPKKKRESVTEFVRIPRARLLAYRDGLDTLDVFEKSDEEVNFLTELDRLIEERNIKFGLLMNSYQHSLHPPTARTVLHNRMADIYYGYSGRIDRVAIFNLIGEVLEEFRTRMLSQDLAMTPGAEHSLPLVQSWTQAMDLLKKSSIRNLDSIDSQGAIFRGVFGEKGFEDVIKTSIVRTDKQDSSGGKWGDLDTAVFWATNGGREHIPGILFKMPFTTLDSKYQGSQQGHQAPGPVNIEDVTQAFLLTVDPGTEYKSIRDSIRIVEIRLPGMKSVIRDGAMTAAEDPEMTRFLKAVRDARISKRSSEIFASFKGLKSKIRPGSEQVYIVNLYKMYGTMGLKPGFSTIFKDQDSTIYITNPAMTVVDQARSEAKSIFIAIGLGSRPEMKEFDTAKTKIEILEILTRIIRLYEANQIRLNIDQFIDLSILKLAIHRMPDAAMAVSKGTKGGIDLNSANLSMMIKRDGKGIILPLNQQDLAQLSNIEGLEPEILSIKPASETPVFSQLK